MELTKATKTAIQTALKIASDLELVAKFFNESEHKTILEAIAWVDEQEIPHPLHVSKEPCPYCNRFTTVWRTGDSGTINIRRCENCYNHFVYFTLHPEHGTQVVTEEAFHNMLHQPGPRSFP